MSESAIRNPQSAIRRGFTLIELLITITIIGMLASMALGALFMAQEKARKTKTQTTIYKLHAAIMDRWESYHYRRLPITIVPGERVMDMRDQDGVYGLGFAWRQLNTRRDLMRMELPDRWSDVTLPPNGTPLTGIPRPPLSVAYRRYHSSRPNIDEVNESAECLYMILSMGEDTSLVSEQVSHADVGDTDGDGAKEFIDAWGNPIRFLRWAPGFVPVTPYGPSHPHYPNVEFVAVDSSLQTVVAGTAGTSTIYEEHDPFDTRNVHNPARGGPIQTLAYALYPLIYSAGPDGVPDMLHKIENPDGSEVPVMLDSVGMLDPYVPVTNPTDPSKQTMIGQPYDKDGDGLQHLDNIHNHLKPQR